MFVLEGDEVVAVNGTFCEGFFCYLGVQIGVPLFGIAKY